MDSLRDFEIGFLDAEGALIQTVPVAAESVTIAACRAAEIVSEIDAADFFITSKSEYLQWRAHSAF